jgi:glycosyltransferase involved in cell wall biosynthesis
MTDLAVVAMDPVFGGGGLAYRTAFVRTAADLGRVPEVHYGRMPSRFRPVDSANQLATAGRLARRLRDARSVWVVTTAASYGLGAALSGRPYSCWIATGVADEWSGRRPRLSASRRAALRVNGPVLQRMERRVLRGAAHVYGISPWSRASVARAAGLPEERVGVLPIPIDLGEFAPAPEEDWRRTLETPVLAFVGRADDPRKNAALLMDAVGLLPDVHALLIGSPPAGAPPERVEATGFVASVAAQLRRATLLVLPSYQEAFGIVVAEALAAGVPVVTTPSGGPESLVEESGGGIVLSGFSAEELAEAVRGLLADPGRLAEMRRRGHEYVQREHSQARFRELLAAALERDAA